MEQFGESVKALVAYQEKLDIQLICDVPRNQSRYQTISSINTLSIQGNQVEILPRTDRVTHISNKNDASTLSKEKIMAEQKEDYNPFGSAQGTPKQVSNEVISPRIPINVQEKKHNAAVKILNPTQHKPPIIVKAHHPQYQQVKSHLYLI